MIEKQAYKYPLL